MKINQDTILIKAHYFMFFAGELLSWLLEASDLYVFSMSCLDIHIIYMYTHAFR